MRVEQSKIETETLHTNTETRADLLRELVAHLRKNRTQLREEWARRIREARLLTAMSEEEIFSEATSVYDNYVEVLETGNVEALQEYARNLSERIIPRCVETHEVLGIVPLLRDDLADRVGQYRSKGVIIDVTGGEEPRITPYLLPMPTLCTV